VNKDQRLLNMHNVPPWLIDGFLGIHMWCACPLVL
jgi:hypothetical protein